MKILLYKGRARLFNRAVCWIMRGNYSHCEAVVMEGIDGTLMCWSSSFMDGGIRRKFIRPDWNHWDMIEVDADRHQVAQWFEAREGQRYDLLGLAGFVFRRFADDSKKYFCSEAVAAALGIPEPWRFDPNTLAAALGRRA